MALVALALVVFGGCGGAGPATTERPTVSVKGVAYEERTLQAIVDDLTSAELKLHRDGRVAECNALVEVINLGQGPLKRLAGSDPTALRNLATLLDGVEARTRAVGAVDHTLRQFRDDFARTAGDLAQASRDVADALDENNPQKAVKAAKPTSGTCTAPAKVCPRTSPRHTSS